MNLNGIPESTHYQEATSSFIRAANAFLQAHMDPLGTSINKDPTPLSMGDDLGSSGLSRAQLHNILNILHAYHSGRLNLNDKIPKGPSYDNNLFNMFGDNSQTEYGF